MRQLRKILFPFSVIYHGVTMLRNWAYDKGVVASRSYDFPLIVVGNLSTGGTGKSPMVEYIIRLFKDTHTMATLSRGYGRRKKGYIKVEPHRTASEVGDEPLQFAKKFKDITIAVAENRQEGIARLLEENASTELIVLDDAFQHRRVKAGFYILLTAYDTLYANDLILPAGNLRESRRGAQRAQCIIVTKCPETLTEQERANIVKKLRPNPNQSVFFASIGYSDIIFSADGQLLLHQLANTSFALVTGIANPSPLLQFLDNQGLNYQHFKFGDHHDFALSEIKMLEQQDIILTTEKDYMRLHGQLKQTKLYYLPIETVIHDGALFDAQLKAFVNGAMN